MSVGSENQQVQRGQRIRRCRSGLQRLSRHEAASVVCFLLRFFFFIPVFWTNKLFPSSAVVFNPLRWRGTSAVYRRKLCLAVSSVSTAVSLNPVRTFSCHVCFKQNQLSLNQDRRLQNKSIQTIVSLKPLDIVLRDVSLQPCSFLPKPREQTHIYFLTLTSC